MERVKSNRVRIRATTEEFGQALDFVRELLERSSVSTQIAMEATLVFEALLGLIRLQGFGESVVINISGEQGFGNFNLKIGFVGKRFNLSDDGEGGASPELRIIEGFGEKVSCNYHRGYNTIRISVQTSPKAFMASCGISLALAIVAYLIICLFTDADTRHVFMSEYLFPIEQLFGNALLMVGPPVTLLSLLKNVSDVFIASERSADSHRLWVKAIFTSCFAIALAVATSFVMSLLIAGRGYYAGHTTEVVDHSFASLVTSMVPASIFEPFEAISPIPLVFVAAITTYALCNASTYFDQLKTAINALYELFSWMLRAVMMALPVFCFMAFLEALLDVGFVSLLYIVEIVLSIAGGVLVLFASYAIRLRAKGVNVRAFAKKLLPLLRENVAINSSIDAAPYNIRYCTRNFGMSREKLSSNLPILAQLSLDGNCFILMYIAMICIFMSVSSVPWPNVVGIAALVLFLELGAPNQPGGILIGTMIVITYLNLPDMLRMAIYLEMFLGSAQNIINVMSNIVAMAEDEGVRLD